MQRKPMKPLISALAVAAGAMAIAVPQASAEDGRVCRPGPSGNVCSSVETSGTYVRGRLGIDPSGTGATICGKVVNLWTRDVSGNWHSWGSNTQELCSTWGHVTMATPYMRQPCDEAHNFEVHVSYTVTQPNGTKATYGYPTFPAGVPVRLGPVAPFCR